MQRFYDGAEIGDVVGWGHDALITNLRTIRHEVTRSGRILLGETEAREILATEGKFTNAQIESMLAQFNCTRETTIEETEPKEKRRGRYAIVF